MTQQKSNNHFEENNISIQIREPYDLIVLSIPENIPGINDPIKITISIINNTSEYFTCLYENIVPELIAPNGEVIQRKLTVEQSIVSSQTNTFSPSRIISQLGTLISDLKNSFGNRKIRKPDCLLLRPGIPNIFSVTARFAWFNNSLRLLIPTTPKSLLNTTNSGNFWSFDDLLPGIYQLRFTYSISDEVNSEVDSRAITVRKEIILQKFESSLLNLHLVNSVSNDKNAIDINGIRFKIEMLESQLNAPVCLPGAKTSFRLGVNVTNNTSTQLRFERLNSIEPILLKDNDQVIEPDSDVMRLWVDGQPAYYSAMPGESTFFALNGMLYRNFFNHLQLTIPNEAGGFWYFRNLKLGKYRLQFIYEATAVREIGETEKQPLDNCWIGSIAIPFVEFIIK